MPPLVRRPIQSLADENRDLFGAAQKEVRPSGRTVRRLLTYGRYSGVQESATTPVGQ